MNSASLFGALLGLAVLLPTTVAAQSYPTRAVTMVVPYPAGGSPDVLVRIVTDKVAANWGTPIVIENRPGAGGSVGTAVVARANPDGYTLLAATLSTVTNPAFQGNAGWSPTADLAGVIELLTAPVVALVPSTVPAKTLQEFVALAKSQPDRMNYLMPGVGTSMHLNTELLKSIAGISMTAVPYQGVPPGMADLLSGRLSYGMAPMSIATGHVNSGALRALAVAAPKRVKGLPNVPTFAEAGFPDAQVVSWYAIAAPKKVPANVIARLNAEFAKALADPGVRERLENAGAVVSDPTTGAQVDEMFKTEFARWQKAAKELKLEKQ